MRTDILLAITKADSLSELKDCLLWDHVLEAGGMRSAIIRIKDDVSLADEEKEYLTSEIRRIGTTRR